MTHSGSEASVVARLDAVHEYEREPVSPDKLHDGKTFVAMFAGEHVAGTEFVIGPLFVAHGVSAHDFFVGLLVGNALAVLSWALLCAPTAVRSRLTVYWQLRKIGGPYLTVFYSGLAAVVMCVVAGAMLAVSSTAVGVPLDIQNPDAMGTVPDAAWIGITLVLGGVVTVIAMCGFERMAHFAKICAPWMPLIFVAAALATLPSLGCTSVRDFWMVAETRMFTGVPFEGVAPYGFWHVVGFAWLCNSTQHLGMSDITLFRYARKWQYGFASAFGMFIGHYIAWIASGVLCAAAVAQGVPTNPGAIAWLGAGWAGIVCVVLAGWTTANPTLYRAGLAFQVATPGWRRWRITLLAGVVMTTVACLPSILASLDRLLAYCGLFFLPLGACIFADMWLFPRLGLAPDLAEKRRLMWAWPVAVAWIGSFLVCFVIAGKDRHAWLGWANDLLPARVGEVDVLFLALPGWLIALGLYITCGFMQQRLGAAVRGGQS